MIAVTDPIALPLRRSPKQTLHHVWAPKLRRTIMFTSADQLHLWVILEAHPRVTRYCERPSWSAEPDLPFAADFWVILEGTAVWLVIEAPSFPEQSSEPHADTGPTVQRIGIDAINRHRVWIQNWLALLPYLSSTSSLDIDSVVASVVDFVGVGGKRFEDVERHFSGIDTVVVRSATIAALHRGSLVSQALQDRPWDLGTEIFRCPRSSNDAAQ